MTHIFTPFGKPEFKFHVLTQVQDFGGLKEFYWNMEFGLKLAKKSKNILMEFNYVRHV